MFLKTSSPPLQLRVYVPFLLQHILVGNLHLWTGLAVGDKEHMLVAVAGGVSVSVSVVSLQAGACGVLRDTYTSLLQLLFIVEMRKSHRLDMKLA